MNPLLLLVALNAKKSHLPEKIYYTRKLFKANRNLRKRISDNSNFLNGILVNLPQSPSPTSRSPHSQSISSTTTTTTLLPLLGSNGLQHCQGSSVNNSNHYSSVTVIGALAPSRNFV
ncbi:hypothetical protein Ddc_17331 [Ditylenchus destructor]|nr:hypothetical protein Ddc_17331 [Ditylenchus destructor]